MNLITVIFLTLLIFLAERNFAAAASTTKTTAAGTESTSWNFDNQLTALSKPSVGSYSYQYDHRARRVTHDESLAGGVKTLLSFSGGSSVQEASAAGVVVSELIRGSDWGGGVGGLSYSIRSGARSYNGYNSRGDVISTSDSSGSATWQASYQALGRRTAEQGANADRQRGNTKDEDPTGLLNEGHRYRDLETGEFISKDPMGFIDGPNVYTYARQNPWSGFDPEGLQKATEADRIATQTGHAPMVLGDENNYIKLSTSESGAVHYMGGAGDSKAANPVEARAMEAVASDYHPENVMALAKSAAGAGPFGRAAVNAALIRAGAPASKLEAAFAEATPFLAAVGGGLAGPKVQGPSSSARTTGAATKLEVAKTTSNVTTAIQPYFPANSGFLGATEKQFLMPGQIIDRFGGSGYSRFFSPAGTSEAARALPTGSSGQQLHSFEVMKPFPVDAGTVAPAFGKPGLGQQFVSPAKLETLLQRDILRESP